jgi:hypothetical protein
MVIYLWQKRCVDLFGFAQIPPGQYLVIDPAQICPHILKISTP